MQNPIQYVASVLGDFLNGVMQVFISFLNAVIEALPNPDPFPTMIQNMDLSTAGNMGFAFYWIDAFCGVDTCVTILAGWAALMVASSIFALVYVAVKGLKS